MAMEWFHPAPCNAGYAFYWLSVAPPGLIFIVAVCHFVYECCVVCEKCSRIRRRWPFVIGPIIGAACAAVSVRMWIYVNYTVPFPANPIGYALYHRGMPEWTFQIKGSLRVLRHETVVEKSCVTTSEQCVAAAMDLPACYSITAVTDVAQPCVRNIPCCAHELSQGDNHVCTHTVDRPAGLRRCSYLRTETTHVSYGIHQKEYASLSRVCTDPKDGVCSTGIFEEYPISDWPMMAVVSPEGISLCKPLSNRLFAMVIGGNVLWIIALFFA